MAIPLWGYYTDYRYFMSEPELPKKYHIASIILRKVKDPSQIFILSDSVNVSSGKQSVMIGGSSACVALRHNIRANTLKADLSAKAEQAGYFANNTSTMSISLDGKTSVAP